MKLQWAGECLYLSGGEIGKIVLAAFTCTVGVALIASQLWMVPEVAKRSSLLPTGVFSTVSKYDRTDLSSRNVLLEMPHGKVYAAIGPALAKLC